MNAAVRSKGTWMHRLIIRSFTIVLAVLVFWVLGFLVEDVQSVRGPSYPEIEREHVDPALLAERDHLDRQIDELSRQIENRQATQRLVGDSSRNLQQTISQLLELQKLGLEKSIAFSETEQENFTTSLNLFLDNQRRYQELSRTIAEMLEQKQDLVQQKRLVELEIDQQRLPAREEFAAKSSRHRLKLAFLQLAILLPILAVAAVLVIRKRGSIYFPLFLAFAAATLVKVALVVHEYFPTRYFKYILIGGLLLAVIRLLVFVIRGIAFPKAQSLIKQHREAYERFLCPVCEYPIRIGPRRFLFWTRRTVNKTIVPGEQKDQDEEYTCPSCGNRLFEKCSACGGIRHVLLPHCRHCGAERSGPASAPAA